jgi:hypothetical protein
VDATNSLVSGTECFGTDGVGFITLHHDTDLRYDTGIAGICELPWDQMWSWWPTGTGSGEGTETSHTWAVHEDTSYQWLCSAGHFTDPTLPTPTWTAPRNAGADTASYRMSLVVTYRGGRKVRGSYMQRVSPAAPSARPASLGAADRRLPPGPRSED